MVNDISCGKKTYPYRHVPKDGWGLPLYDCYKAAVGSRTYNRNIIRGSKISYALSCYIK